MFTFRSAIRTILTLAIFYTNITIIVVLRLVRPILLILSNHIAIFIETRLRKNVYM